MQQAALNNLDGSTPIMAAFTHLNPNGSRFSDGTFGVFYVGRTLTTAIRENHAHRASSSMEDPSGVPAGDVPPAPL